MKNEANEGENARISFYKKIAEVEKAIGYIQKKNRNDTQKYTYLSDAVVTEEVGKAMLENGIISLPPKVLSHGLVFDIQTKTPNRPMRVTHVQVEFRIADIDTGEIETGIMDGYGSDIGDKGLNCALTSARKYFYIQTFNISSGDDPEEYHIMDEGQQQRPTKQVTTTPNNNAPIGPVSDIITDLQGAVFNVLTTRFMMKPEDANNYMNSNITMTVDGLNQTLDSLQEMSNKGETL